MIRDVNGKYQNSIEWISSYGIRLNASNLSVPERLSKYGYVLIIDQMGNEKASKAQLAILDVMCKVEKPNILIYCPNYLMQPWYNSIVLQLGIEFKYTKLSKNTVSFFSSAIANFYIASDSEIDDMTWPGADQQFVWDLMIIDVPMSMRGMDVEYYERAVQSKAKKMIISAPLLFPYGADDKPLRQFIKNHLYHSDQINDVDSHFSGSMPLGLDFNSPIMKNSIDEGERHLIALEYRINPAITTLSQRIDTSATGVPLYRYGGNVFEEYNLNERSIYLKSEYTLEDIKVLCRVDTKLAVFLDKLRYALEDNASTAVVYFVKEKTLQYVMKVISVLYPDQEDCLCVQSGNVAAPVPLWRFFDGKEQTVPKIVLAVDNITSMFSRVERVGSIFNYEYPENPVIMNQRYYRRGRDLSFEPDFYVFTDSDMRFDGRLLQKVVLRNFYRAYRYRIPSKNILVHLPNLETYITDLLLDLKYISDYTGEVGASFDVISQLRIEYNPANAEEITTASAAHEFAQAELKALVNMFELETIFQLRDVDRNQVYKKVSEVCYGLRESAAYYNREMKLCATALQDRNEYYAYSDAMRDNRFVTGLKKATALIDELAAERGGKDYFFFRHELTGLSDALTVSTLYNVWRYLLMEKGINKPYRDFIELYNRGEI